MSRAIGRQAYRKSDISQKVVVCPEGEWRGKLLLKSWGRKVNLLCIFENLATGELHRCIAFRTHDSPSRYTPRNAKVDFSKEGIEGRSYLLNTGVNGKGNPAWYSAVPL